MKVQKNIRKGMNLVEISIVILIGILMFLPMTKFWFMSQKQAVKGFDRLETLTTARIVLEKVQRDMKAYCFTPAKKFSKPSDGQFEFLISPGVEYVKASNPDGKIALNGVKYTFDKAKGTLLRTLKYHSRYHAVAGKTQTSELVGRNIASFSINLNSLFKLNYFDIEVLCKSPHPLRGTENTHLRTAVRSDFECRLARHLFQIPNLKTEFLEP
ncbi:MAG: hypothetical protein HQM10_04015 [Candidatus Riflebacteria bacterium]|nr:hypothetical protein [Candidatus Riflebacteria bacterium]